jgi:hypothetical protein
MPEVGRRRDACRRSRTVAPFLSRRIKDMVLGNRPLGAQPEALTSDGGDWQVAKIDQRDWAQEQYGSDRHKRLID